VAGIGPLSIITGSEPTWVKRRTARAGAGQLFCLFPRGDQYGRRAVEIWLELPAVKNSSPSKAGFNVAAVPLTYRHECPDSVDDAAFGRHGQNFWRSQPLAVALAARSWLRALNSSSAARDRPHWRTIISAPMA